MLAPGMTLPATLGASAPYANSGSLRTRGWELGISWNHRFGDVDVFASANIYDGKTKVTEYNNPNKLINQFYSGMEYGEIWASRQTATSRSQTLQARMPTALGFMLRA